MSNKSNPVLSVRDVRRARVAFLFSTSSPLRALSIDSYTIERRYPTKIHVTNQYGELRIVLLNAIKEIDCTLLQIEILSILRAVSAMTTMPIATLTLIASFWILLPITSPKRYEKDNADIVRFATHLRVASARKIM